MLSVSHGQTLLIAHAKAGGESEWRTDVARPFMTLKLTYPLKRLESFNFDGRFAKASCSHSQDPISVTMGMAPICA